MMMAPPLMHGAAAPVSAPAAAAPAKTEDVPAPGVPLCPATLRVPTAQLRQDTRLMNLLRDAVQACADETGWARVGAVGTQIGNKTSFDARNYGYATLSRLLAAVKEFDFRDEGTSLVSVKSRRIAKGRADN